jgi:hypothetical protein
MDDLASKAAAASAAWGKEHERRVVADRICEIARQEYVEAWQFAAAEFHDEAPDLAPLAELNRAIADRLGPDALSKLASEYEGALLVDLAGIDPHTAIRQGELRTKVFALAAISEASRPSADVDRMRAYIGSALREWPWGGEASMFLDDIRQRLQAAS